MKADVTANGGHGGRDSTAFTAVGNGKQKAYPKADGSNTQDKQREEDGIGAHQIIEGKRKMNYPFRQQLEQGDKKGRKNARYHREGETGQKQMLDAVL